MKVIKHFFCIQEKKLYEVGDNYTGSRTDLAGHLEAPAKEVKETPKEPVKVKEEKTPTVTKELKAAPVTKKVTRRRKSKK